MRLFRHNDPMPSEPLQGVNLGGWLVLEKWITPSIFRGTAVVDEYTLCSTADDERRRLIRAHYDSFITRDDFRWLRDHGVRAVRLPVGYGLFGDQPPYFSTVTYVDKACKWAAESDIKILLDLHTAPGSQNGLQESGRLGSIGWHKDAENIRLTLDVIARLSERYGHHPALLGFELLNEPSGIIPRRFLRRYYRDAYQIIRRSCGPDPWVVFSDNFKPRRWKHELQQPQFRSVFIDTHQYQLFTPRDRRLNIGGHLKKTGQVVPRRLKAMQKYHPVIVGEWSLALDAHSLQGFDGAHMDMARAAYGNAQRVAFKHVAAWFYWTYKTGTGGPWSFRDAIEKSWLLPLKNNTENKTEPGS